MNLSGEKVTIITRTKNLGEQFVSKNPRLRFPFKEFRNALAKIKGNSLGQSRLRSFNPADAKSSFYSAHITYAKYRADEEIR